MLNWFCYCCSLMSLKQTHLSGFTDGECFVISGSETSQLLLLYVNEYHHCVHSLIFSIKGGKLLFITASLLLQVSVSRK